MPTPLKICAHCGCGIPRNDSFTSRRGTYVCSRCIIEEVDQPITCVYCDKPVVNNGSFVRRHNGWICADCYNEVPHHRTISGKLGKAEPVTQPKEKPVPQLHLSDIVDDEYELDLDNNDDIMV